MKKVQQRKKELLSKVRHSRFFCNSIKKMEIIMKSVSFNNFIIRNFLSTFDSDHNAEFQVKLPKETGSEKLVFGFVFVAKKKRRRRKNLHTS